MGYQPVDRVPNIEVGCWWQTRDRWLSEGMPADTGLERAHITFNGNEFFGLDRQINAEIDVGLLPPFEREVVEEDARTQLVRDENGVLMRVLKDDSSMPQFLEYPVRTRRDLRRMGARYDPATPGRYPPDWPGFVRQSTTADCPVWFPGIGSIGLYSRIREWMGTEAACTVFYDNPDLARDMVEQTVAFTLETLRPALAASFDYFMWWEDFAFKTGPLVSPRIFEEFLLPGYRRANDQLRHGGVDIICIDTDGDPRALIPLLLEAGFNCLLPCEQCNAGMHPLALRRNFGRDLLLWGGIDKRALARGKAAIDEELTSKLPPLVQEGGYIPQLDHLAPPDVPYENWLYYLTRKRALLEQ